MGAQGGSEVCVFILGRLMDSQADAFRDFTATCAVMIIIENSVSLGATERGERSRSAPN